MQKEATPCVTLEWHPVRRETSFIRYHSRSLFFVCSTHSHSHTQLVTDMAHYGNYNDSSGYGQYDPPYPMQHMQTPTMASDDGYGVDHNRKAGRQHGQYQHLSDGGGGGAPVLYVEEPRRRSCMDKLCCGCCTCLPKWIRYICCIILLLIICIAIVIGVLAGIFKVPDVKFNGIQGEPQFSINGTTANFVFNLNITIDNPNVESITFEDVVAKVRKEDRHGAEGEEED